MWRVGDRGERKMAPCCLERVRSPPLLNLPAILLSIAFAGQRLFDAEFLTRLQVESVSLDFPDDVLLQNLPLEAAERIFQRLAFLEPYLGQMVPPA